MITEALINFIVNIISSIGYGGLFILSFLEGAVVPVPLEATLVFSGFLTSTGTFNFFLAVLIGFLGNFIGSLIAFALIKHIGRYAVLKLIRKYGQILLISEEELEKLTVFFGKHGIWSIILIRLVPGFRPLLIIPLGLSKISYRRFIIFYAISCFVNSLLLITIGYKIASSWGIVVPIIQKLDIVILVGIFLIITLYLKHKLKLKRAQKT